MSHPTIKSLPILAVAFFGQVLAYAKPIADAAKDEVDSQVADPNGFRLMMMCIGLLFVLALSLIGGTMFYFFKSKKKS
jgi:hypothetical protein